jgi:hypothetical protein
MATSTLNRDAQLSTLSNTAYFYGVAYPNDFTRQVRVSFRGTAGKTAMKLARWFVFFGLGLCALMSIPQVGWAQTERVAEGPSYNERWRVFQPGYGTKDVDPNVYVYTPEFAKRFQMPAEWVSTELQGADAVAYRSTPTYASCGWGGSPKACNTNEMRCELDVYFDHQRHPLPWDERYPEVLPDRYRSSARFIPGGSRQSRLPKHQNYVGMANFSPFIDLKSGKGLGWQHFKKGSTGGGWTSLASYDREFFEEMSLITFNTGCAGPMDELWLTSGYLHARDVPGNPQLKRRVELPVSWQTRVQQAMQENNERSQAFFKREGEKAMKALRESAVPNKSITPVQ